MYDKIFSRVEPHADPLQGAKVEISNATPAERSWKVGYHLDEIRVEHLYLASLEQVSQSAFQVRIFCKL
jgi:hypothetical protein